MPLDTYRQTRLFTFLKLCLSLVTFTVVVSVVSGCSGSSTGSLASDAPPAADVPKLLSITPLTKTVALGATLSLEVSGGAEPYTFDVYYGNGTVTSSAATGTYHAPSAQGSAVVRVQDAAGNTGYATVEIIDVPVIQPTSKTLAVTNKFPFAVLSGKAPYTFSINSGEGAINSTTGEFTAGANAGAVVVRVTDADGRTADANVTVNAALSFTNKNVYVEKNATSTLAATGGVAPYTYMLASGAGSVDKTSGVFTAPSALGTTSVLVFDSLGNVDWATVNITTTLGISPASALIAKNTNLSFSATGGVPPYSYSIQTGGIGTISALTGEYTAPAGTGSATVRVTDGLGNTSDASVTVTNSISFSVANLILAVGNSYDFLGIVNGGMAPLTYTVPSSQGIFTGSTYTAPNTPGVYTITVTDSQSPTPNTVTTIVAVNSALTLLPETSTVVMGAQKSLSASGGVPPYTYTVQSGDGSITAGIYTAPDVSGSAVILVTDARGNTATASITIQAALAVVPTTKTLSSGESFTFTATGGNTPYVFSLVSGSGAINSSTGLYTAPGSSGLATVRVEDAAGNRKDALVTILNPLSISPVTISLIKNGAITFTASGGAGPYSFSVVSGEGSINASSGVFTASTIAGSTTIRVTDSLGSIKDATVTIYDGLSISPFTKSLAVNQTFTFTANGGVSPYTYSLVSGVGSISVNGAYAASTAGAAAVRVTDASGNTSDATISVNSALAINPTSKTLSINNQFSFSATGGVPPYAFSILSGSGTVTTAGDYKAPATSTSAVIRVTDSSGSTADSTVTVNDALTISPVNSTLAAGGAQSFIAAGGVGPYVYAVVSGGGSFTGATFTAPSVASGASVSILTTDTLGNTANATVTVNPIFVTISSPNSSSVITSSNKTAFAVSGTCSESGRTVTVSATGGITPTTQPTCASGAWSTTLNLTAAADGSVTITANHANVNSVAATQASVTLSKDGTSPTITITAPTNGSYVSNAVTVSGACTKAGPVNIAITGGITAVTSCAGGTYSSVSLNLTSLADGALTITADHTDSAGNSATPATVNVTKDTVAPVITAFAVTNTSPTNITTYNLTFTATDSPTEYCILENSTIVDSCSWYSVALPTTFIVSSTNNAKVLTAWVKDAAGNVSTASNSNSVTLDTAAPAAPSAISLSDPANSPGIDTTPTFLVSGLSVGDAVTIHTNNTCSGGTQKGTANVSTGTTVTVTSSVLSAGSYTFYAKRTNAAGTASDCSTANVAYVLDLTAATVTNVTASSNGPFTTADTFTISIQFSKIVNVTGTPILALNTGRTGAQASYSSGSSSNTLVFTYTVVTTDSSSDLTYTDTASLTLNSGTMKDGAGNNVTLTLPVIGAAGSLSNNQTIVIDAVAPTAPTAIVDGAYLNSTSASPTITFTSGTDVGGTGILKHQIQVIRASDSVVMKAWADFTSGTAVTTGLTLTDATQYKVQLKAIDNVGNESSIAVSDGWTVDTTLPSVPTGLTLGSVPGSTSITPTISWTASTDASGIQYYQVQVHKTSDNSIVQVYTTLVSGGTLTGLSLAASTQYYVNVRAVDNVGNIGNDAQSSNWTAAAPFSQVYSYTGGLQSLTIPGGCTSILVKMWGAGGGGGKGSSATKLGTPGGGGGFTTATLATTVGNTIYILVGGGGVGGNGSDTVGGAGGYGGGAHGGGANSGWTSVAGGGGGYSGIFTSSSLTQANALLMAGGGGGGSNYNTTYPINNGGAGGGTSGAAGTCSSGSTAGTGGTQSAGGTGGGSSGTALTGGIGNQGSGWSGGGGGGGYYGGGGASGQAGGGGGSGYVGGAGVSGASTAAGSATTPGGNTDAGYVAGIAVGGAAAPSGGTTGSTGGNGRVSISCQ